MIASLFKNDFFSYLVVSIIGIIIWSIAYFEAVFDEVILFNIANEEYLIYRRTAILFSFFVTIFGANFLNYKLKKCLFSYEPTNLFLLFYVIINSFGLHLDSIIEYNLVCFLLIFLVDYLFHFVETNRNENQIFNSSFIIGLLIFQNLFFVILVPLLILNLGVIKRINLKEIALILTGFLLPTIFIIVFSILTENIEILRSLFYLEINPPKIPWKFALYFLILIFISFKGYRLVVTKRSGIDINIIRLTKNMFIFFIAMSIIVGLSLFSFQKEYAVLIFAIPLSIFLSDFFANSLYKYRELLFLIVILTPFLMRYLN